MSELYYTPLITEFRVGFRYEELCVKWSNGGEWAAPIGEEWLSKVVQDFYRAQYFKGDYENPMTVHTSKDFICYHLSLYNNMHEPIPDWDKKYRVKYLNRQDIQSFDWEYHGEIKLGIDIFYSRSGELSLTHNTGLHRVTIQLTDGLSEYNGFIGIIKNISILEQVMEMLQIK